MAVGDLITENLLGNKAFKADVAKLFSLPRDVLLNFRTNLPASPHQLADEQFVRDRAERSGMSVEDYTDLAPVSKMLITGLGATSTTTEELFAEIREKLGIVIEDESIALLQDFFAPHQADEEESKEVQAFSFGNTFASSELTPFIVPDDGSDKIYFGGALEIKYIADGGATKAITLNISHLELSALIVSLEMSRKRLDALSRRFSENGD